ncbi:MAG: hypothetical protein F4X64_15570 [Chloroflexi bacterium]|nr:hypothetical protein [Chloroflexota bacterium]
MSNLAAKPQTPREYLAAGEAAFENGDKAVGCILFWKAVESTFAGLAESNGLDLNRNTLSQVARAIDEKQGLELHYLGGLSIGQSMKHNAEFDYMGPNELEMVMNGVRKFVLKHA